MVLKLAVVNRQLSQDVEIVVHVSHLLIEQGTQSYVEGYPTVKPSKYPLAGQLQEGMDLKFVVVNRHVSHDVEIMVHVSH